MQSSSIMPLSFFITPHQLFYQLWLGLMPDEEACNNYLGPTVLAFEILALCSLSPSPRPLLFARSSGRLQ